MKRYHIVSIVLLVVSIILVITSIVGPSVPWSQFIEPLSSSCYTDYDCDIQQVCNSAGYCINPTQAAIYRSITLGLTEYTYCQGTSDKYSTDDPKNCSVGGFGILVLSSLGTATCFLVMIFTVLRAKYGGMWRYTAITTPAVASLLFLTSWTYWLGGCHRALTQSNHNFTISTGFALAVVCWIVSFLSVIIQGCIRHPKSPEGYSSQQMQPQKLDEMKSPKVTNDEPENSIDEEAKEEKVDEKNPALPANEGAIGDVGYTPYETGKTLHLITILFAITAIICGGISVSSQAVPWTKLERSWFEIYGFNPPDDDSSTVILRAGLLSWELCFGSTTDYGEYDPTICRHSGKNILGISILGIISTFVAVFAVYFRGRGRGGTWTKVACILCTLISTLAFVASWALWTSYKGCQNEMGRQNEVHLQASTGWILTVTASVLVFLAFVLQIAGLCLPGHLAYQRALPVGTQRVQDDKYISLLDAEVPYL